MKEKTNFDVIKEMDTTYYMAEFLIKTFNSGVYDMLDSKAKEHMVITYMDWLDMKADEMWIRTEGDKSNG